MTLYLVACLLCGFCAALALASAHDRDWEACGICCVEMVLAGAVVWGNLI